MKVRLRRLKLSFRIVETGLCAIVYSYKGSLFLLGEAGLWMLHFLFYCSLAGRVDEA